MKVSIYYIMLEFQKNCVVLEMKHVLVKFEIIIILYSILIFVAMNQTVTCQYCHEVFANHRGLTMHFKYCPNNKTNNHVKKKMKLTQKSLLDSERIEKVPTKLQDNVAVQRPSHESNSTEYLMENMHHDNMSYLGITDGLQDCHKNAVLEHHGNNKSTMEDVIQSEENKAPYELLLQEKDYQSRMQSSETFWSKNDLCKLELLYLLKKHKCPNSVYKDVLGWANFYANSKECNIFLGNRIDRREVALKDLMIRRNMENMRPIKKTIWLGQEQGHEIHVTTFDFKQQLLSMLRDNELIHPNNLALHEPMLSTSSTETRKDNKYISEIHDSIWYKCASDYYVKKMGKDPYRVICGIILTVDKTHTDAKGKLCLEPVQFSISILNTKTRKKNPNAWKCLGFINDLDAYIYSEHNNVTGAQKQTNRKQASFT